MSVIFIYSLADSQYPEEVRYIGKTNNVKSRLQRHTSAYYLQKKNYKANWIQSVLNAGRKIILEIVDVVTENDWGYWESYWIAQFRAWGFKLTNGTTGGEGIPLTPEVIARRNQSNTGRVFSEETKAKIRLANLGREVPTERREKIRQTLLGGKASEETKAKLSKMRMGSGNHFHGKTHTSESLELMKMNHPLRKEIEQYDKTGKLIATHLSSYDAQAATGCDRSHITKCCKGKTKQAYGFVWKFKE